jgi:hypothetical protein
VDEPPSQFGNADTALGCLADSCLGKKSSACFTSYKKMLAGLMELVAEVAQFSPTTSPFMRTLTTVSGWWKVHLQSQRYA